MSSVVKTLVWGELCEVGVLPDKYAPNDEFDYYGFAECRACDALVHVYLQWEGDEYGYTVMSTGSKFGGCAKDKCGDKFPHVVRSIGRLVGGPNYEP